MARILSEVSATGIGVRVHRGSHPYRVWDTRSTAIRPGDMLVAIIRTNER